MYDERRGNLNMKKKILSTLLAVSLFVAAAAPAVLAADYSSTQAGDPSKIESIKFSESSYEIKQDEEVAFLDKIQVFENNKKLILDKSQISFELIGADTTFSLVDDKVTAIEKSGTATLVAKDDETGKVTAKVTLKAVPNPAKVYATSFKFEKSKSNLVYDFAGNNAISEGNTVTIVPIPAKSTWSDANYTSVTTAVINKLVETGIATGADAITVSVGDDNELKFAIAANNFSQDKIEAADDAFNWGKVIPLEVTAEMVDKNGKNPKNPVAKASFTPVKAKNYETIAILSSKTIEVGQEFNLGDTVKLGAADANVNNNKTWETGFVNDNAEADDFAPLSDDKDGKILGVAVGKNKIAVTLTSKSNKDGSAVTKTAECTVTVVPAGSIKTTPNGKLSLETASLAVGATQVVTVKDADADAKITWKVSDPTIAQIAPFTGATTRVYAKKAGTVKVTAMVDGVEIGSCEVTVKAADTTAPVNPDKTTPSGNPQTGDSLFVNLF